MHTLVASAGANPIAGEHLLRYLFLTFIIAAVSTYAFQRLAEFAPFGADLRKGWFWGAGLTLACGIGIAHVVGMLGSTDGISISHRPVAVGVAVSLLFLGSVAALFIIASRGDRLDRILNSSAVIGGAIVVMQYLGLWGAGEIQFEPVRVALSVAVGLGLSLLAGWCAYYPEPTKRLRRSGALLLGLAVAGSQYLAITAVTLVEQGQSLESTVTSGILSPILQTATLTLFALVVVALSAKTRLNEQVATILSEMTEPFYVVDRYCRVTYVNRHALLSLGASRGEVLNRRLWEILPEPMTYAVRSRMEEALTSRTSQRFELLHQSRWYEINFYPSRHGLSIYFREITARKSAEQALQSAATEREQARNRFLKLAAHELRNPMTGVKSLLSLLQWTAEQGKPTINVLHAAALMEREVDRMSNLVDQVIDSFRFGEGTVSLKFERVDLVAFVAGALEPYRTEASIHELITNLPVDRAVEVEGAPDHLALVVRALMSNATKYSPAGSQVYVQVGAEDGWALLTVSDHGIGIPSDETDRVFEGFYRASNLKDRDPGGLGLGLFLTREIIRRHGGEVWIQRTGPTGTTVAVSLPLGKEAELLGA